MSNVLQDFKQNLIDNLSQTDFRLTTEKNAQSPLGTLIKKLISDPEVWLPGASQFCSLASENDGLVGK